MTKTASTRSWAPNTRAALLISTAAAGDLLVPAALALTCARAVRHRHAARQHAAAQAPRSSIFPSFVRTS
jgi:hypothetical protein